jgi:predicted membrane-bound spermidine synthase
VFLRSGDLTTRGVQLLASPAVRLFLTSASLLFVELFLLRWIPANVTYVGFFKNFLLLASFLGIGLGILLGRGGRRLTLAPFPILFFAVVKLVSVTQLNVGLSSPNDIFVGPQSLAGAADANVLILAVLVTLAAAVMAALAVPLGPLLRSMPPLRGYSIDIMGSLAGIAIFMVLSRLGTSPALWVCVVALFAGLLGVGSGVGRWSALSAATLVAAIVVAGATPDIWSPYQRLTVIRTGDDVAINANGIPHQQFSVDPAASPGFFYEQIGKWFPGRSFENVLVIGSGNGNDVAVGLRRGDARVDAVEIDPAILDIGRRLYPSQPYQDPRVTTTVDDGRAYLRNSDRRYDLIIFAQPDSLTLFSTANAIRLESFLFTREAFASVRDHLTANGVFVLYNFYWQPWLVDRLGGMLQTTFGVPAAVAYYDEMTGHAAVLATGPGLAATGGLPPGGTAQRLAAGTDPASPTDDWPFLYLRQPGISSYYLLALAVVLLLGVLSVAGAARVAGLALRKFSPHFFVLGTAFMLLETRSLVAFGLLFGNTWIVNSLVFFAILTSVLAAIGVSSRLRPPRGLLYAALALFLAIAWVLPPDALLLEPPALRYLLASVVAFAPVFLANLCFAYSFRDTRAADMAFASNLLGAVVGGAIEYLALITGYQALLLVIAGLYGAAYVFATRARWLADQDLVSGPVDATPELLPTPATG